MYQTIKIKIINIHRMKNIEIYNTKIKHYSH